MTSNYTYLLSKLDGFIKKYYQNQLLRGSIYFTAVVLSGLLVFTTAEYLINFGTSIRLALFWVYTIGILSAALYWVGVPLFKLAKIGKTINHRQAAEIIGTHFSEVKDKLLNTLELQEISQGSKSLIAASVDQKLEELKPVPFRAAVNFKTNKAYLKYALIPLGIVALLLVQMPDVILSSSARILSYNTEFIAPAPFTFHLANEEMEALLHDDFEVVVNIKGDELPASVKVLIDDVPYRMTRQENGQFSYLLNNVERDKSIRFQALEFYSATHELKVLPKPLLKSFKVELVYPPYLNKKKEALENIGDFHLPEGTNVRWVYETENTEKLYFNWNGQFLKGQQTSQDAFVFEQKVMENAQYYLRSANAYVPTDGDSMGYSIQMIKDGYPSIKVEQNTDSNSLKSLFFSGQLSDDYGISQLAFHYTFTKSEQKEKMETGRQSVAIPVSGKNLQSFFHHWDLNSINYISGDEISYYFEVWDNDGVNGRKSSRSTTLFVMAPSQKEIEEEVTESSNEIKDELKNTMKEAADLQKEFKELDQKMAEKEQLSWEDKKNVKELIQKQQAVQKNIQNLNKQYKEMLKKQDAFKEMNPELLKKHEELMKLFDQLMDEDMKKLMEEMQKMLEENKEDLKDEMEDLKNDNESLEDELDAALEHFKQLEFEQKMDETIEKLDKLSEKQEDLAEQTKNEEKSKEELAKEQEELNKEFEEIKKDIEEIEKLNKDMEQSNSLEDTKEEQEEIDEKMKESSEEISKGKNKKAGEKQQEAKEKIDELKEKMESNMSEMGQEGDELDYKALRRLMENLLYLSFEQEKLMDELKEIHSYNPKFVDLAQRQMKLKGDAAMIKDSLVALSKRVMQISGFVTKEVAELNEQMEQTIENLSVRKIQNARRSQQYVMTHTNNLAVMLSEVMDQMQQQMAQKKEGTQNCSKPGNNKKKGDKKGQGQKKKMGGMSKLQEQLNKQIGDMKKKMDGGERPLSKDLAKTAAQQEALRRQLQQLNEAKEAGGEGASKELKELEELMDKTEKDIVNNKINLETIQRQEKILNQLLKSEKAEREQEWDDKRESQAADQIVAPSEKAFEEYKKQRLKEIELLNTVPPQLNGYYKQKVKEYFEKAE